jgi:hypothetical protein
VESRARRLSTLLSPLSSLLSPPMSPTPSFSMAIGHLGFEIQTPDHVWLAALAPLYGEFPLDTAPDWQVSLTHDSDLVPAAQAWIEHTGPLTRFHIENYAGWIDLDLRQASVRTSSLAIAPAAVERTIAYACMQMLPREHNSLLLHAAGILWRGKGLIVSGHSGAGKTTVSRLSLGYGELFNDEMVIVDLSSKPPMLLSTPFLGRKTPPELVRRTNRSASADALLLLAHAPGFELRQLGPSEAVMELLRTDIAAVERLTSAEFWMAVVEQLVESIPVYQLHFRPTAELWDFLAIELDAN